MKKPCWMDKILSQQRVLWNSIGLNTYIVKHEQNGAGINSIQSSFLVCLGLYCIHRQFTRVKLPHLWMSDVLSPFSSLLSGFLRLQYHVNAFKPLLPYPASLIGSCFFVELLEYSDDRHPWENLEAKLNDVRWARVWCRNSFSHPWPQGSKLTF